jgi:hypothetical protein
MKVGDVELNVSFDELRFFQEAFKGRDGTAATVVDLIAGAQALAVERLRNVQASEGELRRAQGAADALDDLIAALKVVMEADLDLLKNQRDGEEEEEHGNGRPIVTP